MRKLRFVGVFEVGMVGGWVASMQVASRMSRRIADGSE